MVKHKLDEVRFVQLAPGCRRAGRQAIRRSMEPCGPVGHFGSASWNMFEYIFKHDD